MRSIQALPESVHSSMRSGIILFDLTRVVEELVFNSIDASATQVSVSVGVGTSSIKVTDNGHGITRDGLELLGERYATSKFEKSTVLDNVSRTFGFHGEALGSISDVSLLEIVSKAQGMPNGYRKVIKGCKCLYLGIDDNRHDVGTTVIVRDLFYNQPVRRKHLQSSPKRVLHSVKESILRIALVHLKISFKVIDIESGDKLLSTSPSTSPLPLLMSGFGVEISGCLRELGVSDGGLKLSGYISVPSEVIPGKGFQYFYINSRFISKGPIQKLLNQLSASFSCSEILKDNIDSRTWKRSRFQTYPTYILNLSCPRAHYDMTFEPSKTSVVFKDWDPVLAFIEKVVTSFWSKSSPYDPVSHGADTSHKEDIWKEADTNLSTANDLLENYGLRKRRCITQCQQVSCDLLSPQAKSPWDESKHMSVGNKAKFSYETYLQVEDGTGTGFPLETVCSIKSCKPMAQSKTIVPQMTGRDTGVPAPYISSLDDLCSENKFLGGGSYEQDHLFSSMKGGASVGNSRNGLTARKLSADSFAVVDGVEGNEHFNKPFLRSCFFHTAQLPDGDPIANDVFSFQGGGSRAEKKSLDIDDIFDIGEDENNPDPEPLQDEAAAVLSSPSLTTTCNVDILLRSTQNDPALENDFNKTDGLRARKLSADCFSDREQDNEHVKDTFPTLLTDGACMENDVVFKFEADGYKTKMKLTNGCDMFDFGEVGDNKGARQLQDDTANVWSSPQIASTSGMDIDSDILLKDFSLPYPFTGECSDEENSLQAEAFVPVRHFGSRSQSSKSCWSPLTLDPLLIDKRPDVYCFIDEDMFEKRFKYQRNAEFDHFADTKGKGDVFSRDRMQFSPSEKDCLSSYSSAPSACKDYAGCKGDIKEFLRDGVLFPENNHRSPDEPEWMYFRSLGKTCTSGDAALDISSLSFIGGERGSRIQAKFEKRMHDFQIQPRRSHSAPPFYRGKKKIFSLNIWQTVKARKPQFVTINDAPFPEEASYLKHIQASSGGDHLSLMEGVGSAPLANSRLEVKQNTDTMEIPDCRLQEDQSNVICNIDSDFTSKGTQSELDFGLKWRSNCSLTAKFEKVGNSCIQDNILDLSSGLLHLSGDSLVPDSISKKCLGDARVLHQVDKKFIPIVAGRTVAIIDQHAADERIRLEDLRQKVLSGEMKSITYLDAEKELVLPEIGYQLLHNYAEQIQKWGWICNFHAQSSTSFKKSLNFLHSQPSVATLLAVPCILGVSLTDVDLLEFLQQLADTDGSSGIPPAVLRVLNYKACRGAIMFGDALLPSECSLIVEELKQTSLCFQCAHGRPTTVPLVDLALLHKHIAKLKRWSSCSNESWHGLTRHKPSLERAAHRLNSD